MRSRSSARIVGRRVVLARHGPRALLIGRHCAVKTSSSSARALRLRQLARAASHPAPPRTPGPGCAPAPPRYSPSIGMACVAQPGDRPHEENLVERDLAVRDRAFGEPELRFEIAAASARRDARTLSAKPGNTRSIARRHAIGRAPRARVVPRSVAETIRRVLHSRHEHVLAGRRERRPAQRRHRDLDVRRRARRRRTSRRRTRARAHRASASDSRRSRSIAADRPRRERRADGRARTCTSAVQPRNLMLRTRVQELGVEPHGIDDAEHRARGSAVETHDRARRSPRRSRARRR